MTRRSDQTNPAAKTNFIPRWYLRASPEQRVALGEIDVCFGANPDEFETNVDTTAVGRFALARGWVRIDSRNPAVEIYERTNPDQQIQVPVSGPIDDMIYMLAEVFLKLTAAEAVTLEELIMELGNESKPSIEIQPTESDGVQ